MNETIESPAALDEAIRLRIEPYIALIRETFGDRIAGLAVFGHAVDGTFDNSRHSVRNVLVLNDINLGKLRDLAKNGARMGKMRISAPLVVSPDYIRASLDTFPLEFLEIQSHHVMVVGEDVFEPLTFEPSPMRLQCERELKTMLIGLRQGLLAASGSEKLLSALELDIGENLPRTLAGMLWLKGKRDAVPPSKLVSTIEGSLDRSMPGIRRAMDPSGVHGWDEFKTLYADLEFLGQAANDW